MHHQLHPKKLLTNPAPNANKQEKNGGGLLSLLCGVGSIISAAFIYLALPLSIGGIFLSIKEQPKTDKGKAGKICSVIGLSLSLLIFLGVFIYKHLDRTYYGNGFTLTYDYTWKEENLPGGQKALIKDAGKTFLVPLSKSNLSDHINYTFDTEAGKRQIYTDFYSVWSADASSKNMSLFNGNNKFSILKNIYFASADYGSSSDELFGNYYILISKEDDFILTFMSQTEPKNFSQTSEEVLNILRSIKNTDATALNQNKAIAESFSPGVTKEATVSGFMNYIIPESWQYIDQISADTQSTSDVYIFRDGKSLLEVQAFTPTDNSSLETGKSYETFKDEVKNTGLTLFAEDTKIVNNIQWRHLVTNEHTMIGFNGQFRSEYYVTFSADNSRLYLFHFYISSTLSSNELKYLNESADYILHHAQLLGY